MKLFMILLLSMCSALGFVRIPKPLSIRSVCRAKKDWHPPPGDTSSDPMRSSETNYGNTNGIAYDVTLSKRAGIDWGADLSFRWVYVTGLDPAGDAFKSGKVGQHATCSHACYTVKKGQYMARCLCSTELQSKPKPKPKAQAQPDPDSNPNPTLNLPLTLPGADRRLHHRRR